MQPHQRIGRRTVVQEAAKQPGKAVRGPYVRNHAIGLPLTADALDDIERHWRDTGDLGAVLARIPRRWHMAALVIIRGIVAKELCLACWSHRCCSNPDNPECVRIRDKMP